jgi:hypothetical protein
MALIFILKQKRFYLKTQTKSLKIKEINQENPENHFNLGIFGIYSILTKNMPAKFKKRMY